MQDIFIIAFDPQFTDIVRGGVVRQLAVFIETVDVFIVNLGYVANHVRQRRAIRVIASLIAFDFYAGKTVLVYGKTRDLDFCQVRFDRNRGETVRTGTFLLKGGNIVIVEIDNVF